MTDGGDLCSLPPEIIAEGSGQAFEPLLVEVFLDIREQVEHTHDQINSQPGGIV